MNETLSSHAYGLNVGVGFVSFLTNQIGYFLDLTFSVELTMEVGILFYIFVRRFRSIEYCRKFFSNDSLWLSLVSLGFWFRIIFLFRTAPLLGRLCSVSPST